MYESSARRPRQPAACKNQHFTTVSDIWPARSDERVHRRSHKFAFHHSFGRPMSETTRGLPDDPGRFAFHLSFGRPMSTKRREGCDDDVQNSHFTSLLDVRRARSDERVATTSFKLRISPQFWTSDEHETTRGFNDDVQNSHFTTVLDVPIWARSDERVVSRLDRPNPPCVKKERNFKEVLIHNHSQQIFFSRSSQQIFFSRSSQQIFSADLLIVLSFAVVRGWWSAIVLSFLSFAVVSRVGGQLLSYHLLWSGVGGQLLSYHVGGLYCMSFCVKKKKEILKKSWSTTILSRSSQQIFSADLLSRSSHCLIICCGQGLVVSYCLIIPYHLPWSGVGGQLLSYHLLWSGVGGQLLSYHVGGLYCMSSLEGPFRGAFGKKQLPCLSEIQSPTTTAKGRSWRFQETIRWQSGLPSLRKDIF